MDPLTVLAGALIFAGGYYISVRLWPYKNCGRCKGTGRNLGSNSRRHGKCGRCGGSGKKLRLGTRLFFRRR